MGEGTGLFGIWNDIRRTNGDSGLQTRLTEFLKKRIRAPLHFGRDLRKFFWIRQVGDRMIKFRPFQIPYDDALRIHVLQDGNRLVSVEQKTFTKSFKTLLAEDIFILAFPRDIPSGVAFPARSWIGQK